MRGPLNGRDHSISRGSRHNKGYEPKHMRVKRVISACSLVMAAVLGIVFLAASGNGNAAQADETSSASGTTIESLTIYWDDVPDGTNPAGTFVKKPDSNESVSFKATFDYALSGSEDHAPGTITIRIPGSIFVGRDDELVSQERELSVPAAPDQSTNSDYNYTYDSATDEYVLTNCKTVAAAGKTSFDVTYTVDDPSDVRDMAPSKDVKAVMSITTSDGSKVQKTSNTINAALDTSAKLDSAAKAGVQQFDTYPSSGWGDAPVDSAQYVYVVWNLAIVLDNSTTQPFAISLADTPGDGQKVVGYRTTGRLEGSYYYSNVKELTDFTPSGEFQSGSTLNLSGAPENTGYYYYLYRVSVLTRYPKDQLDSRGYTTLGNKITASIKGTDDGKGNEVSATAEYVYNTNEITVPAGTTSISKSATGTGSGALNFLKDGKSFLIQRSSSGADPRSLTEGYQNLVEVQEYAMTMADGEDPHSTSSYGRTPYTVELIDDLFYLGEGFPQGSSSNPRFDVSPFDARLEKGDYEIAEISLEDYKLFDYVKKEGSAEYSAEENTDIESYPAITLYGQFDGNNEWVNLGTIRYTAAGQIEFTDSGSGKLSVSSYSSSKGDDKFDVASGCTAVKASVTTTAYEVHFILNVTPRIFPTEHVLNTIHYLENYTTSGNGDVIYARNVNTLQVLDKDGNSISAYDNYGSTGLRGVDEHDTSLYGSARPHANAAVPLTEFKKNGWLNKYGHQQENDVINQRVNLNYSLYMGESVDFSEANVSLDDLIANGIFAPQASVTFYDLLPKGVEPDIDSIKVTDTKGDEAEITVDTDNDWRGSGRVMLVVHAASPAGANNYDSYGNSKFQMEFDAYYPWDNLSDYGTELENDAAVKTGNDEIAKGSPDNGGFDQYDWSNIFGHNKTLQALMTDLDNDGNPEGTKNQFLYAVKTLDVNANITASMSLSKSVKGPSSTDWTDGQDGSVVVSEGDSYQYRLRLGSSKGSSTSDIVLYDSIENYSPANGKKQWHGTLSSVDTSQPESLGVAPVVYYSTTPNLDLSQDANRDLTNTAVWSATAPSDLSKVTAVAVDCRKATDGSDFSLGAGKSMSVILHMKAPTGTAFKQAYNSNAHAYNQVYLQDVLHNIADGKTSNQVIHNEYTQVGVNRSDYAPGYMPTTGSRGRMAIELVGLGLLVGTVFWLRMAQRKGRSTKKGCSQLKV